MKQFKSPIIWRLIVWALLLSLIPLGIVLAFIQRQVRSSIEELRSRDVIAGAEVISLHESSDPKELQKTVIDFGKNGNIIAFVLDEQGRYIAHNFDPNKIGHSLNEDFPADIVQKILSLDSGYVQIQSAKQILGFARSESAKNIAVVILDNREAVETYNRLYKSVALQLVVTLIITSLASGVGVLTVLAPLLRLASFADRLGEGKLDERVDVEKEELEGEIKTLAISLNALATRVQESIQTLEQRVLDRTRDLHIASNVSRQITQTLNLKDLLLQLVEQTKSGFDLYYVSVFLYNDENQELVLEAGTGEAGKHMKLQRKTYHISATPSLVAQSGREKMAVVIQDVIGSSLHFYNPFLPETHSEAAIPMIVQGDLVGVLDLQSVEKNHFNEDDIQILTTLAEQIGVAIKNARLYDEQLETSEKLRTFDKLKSQFLASMSHELRTPLNAVINFVEMIVAGIVGPVSNEQKELLNYSLQSSKHLLHLINDVLDISKIQAGRLTLFLEDDVNLYQEINAAVNILMQPINEKKIQLIQDVDDNLPAISGDKRRIRQILLNLLSNAVKFTEKGTITLSAKLRNNQIIFGVIDTGHGISDDAKEMIFEPFVQTVNGIKQSEGTGLGLPISRSLARAHGGDLWVESQLGEGAAFFFSIPITK